MNMHSHEGSLPSGKLPSVLTSEERGPETSNEVISPFTRGRTRCNDTRVSFMLNRCRSNDEEKNIREFSCSSLVVDSLRHFAIITKTNKYFSCLFVQAKLCKN